MDISLVSKALGRLVIELFDDLVPAAANHLRNRCMPGSSAGLAGAHFHKLLPHYAIHGGYRWVHVLGCHAQQQQRKRPSVLTFRHRICMHWMRFPNACGASCMHTIPVAVVLCLCQTRDAMHARPPAARTVLCCAVLRSSRAGEGMRLQPMSKLRNVEAGTVSISHNGEEIAFALSQALDLDKTHQASWLWRWCGEQGNHIITHTRSIYHI